MHKRGVTVYDPERACHGYTPFTPMTAGNTAYLIDMQEAIVHAGFCQGSPEPTDISWRMGIS
jgi:hypothetical protein